MSITRVWKTKIRPIVYYSTNVGGFDPEGEDRYFPVTEQSLSKSSWNNWNYRTDIRNHTSAVTPREIESFHFEGGWGQLRADFIQNTVGDPNKECYIERYGQIFYPSSWPSLLSSWTNADNEARMKFYKRAKEAQTAFRSLTALGELRETLRMLRDPGRSLRRGLDDYLKNVTKRSRRAKRSSFGRIVSETWLEHVFGWQPLISDIRAAGEGLNRRLNRFAGSYTRIQGTGETNDTDFFTADVASFQPMIQIRYRRMDRFSASVRYYGQVKSVCDNPIQADMQLFGANWREIIPTAWELIPYSFLADYFSNIGDILDAWSLRRSDIAWAGRSIKMTTVRSVCEPPVVSRAYVHSTIGPVTKWRESSYVSYYRSVRQSIVRSNIGSPALPSLRLEIPGFGTKWINMSALLFARNRTRRQLFR